MRRYADAIQMADRTVANFPSSAHTFLVRKGQAAPQAGDLKMVRAVLDAIPAAERNDVDIFLLWYRSAMYARDYEEAKRAIASRVRLEQRERLAPDTFFEGEVARAEGETEKATAAFLDARKGYDIRLRDYPQQSLFVVDAALVDAALGHRKKPWARFSRRSIWKRIRSSDRGF